MPNGSETTLILNPNGRDSITFENAGVSPSGDYQFVVNAGALDFNEEARIRWATEITESGARVVGSERAIVPVAFDVTIRATSSEARSEAFSELSKAITNRKGGTLQFRPEDFDGLHTYYHYIASTPPRVADSTSNRWDEDAKSDGLFVLLVQVALSTQPLATSDPDTPQTVASLSGTIDNWTWAPLNNQITVDADDLKGDYPALIRMVIEAESGQELGRTLLFRRSSNDGDLDNLDIFYLGQGFERIDDVLIWNDIVETGRIGGYVMRCLPPEDGNGTAYGLTTEITNPTDLNGRFAIFGVVYDDADTLGVWTHQVKVRTSGLSQEGASDYFADTLHAWNLMYVGEFDLPLTSLSGATGGYGGVILDWYSTRASGNSEFRLDGVIMVYVSDSLGAEGEGTALDVDCTNGRGISSANTLLIENFLERGRIVDRAYAMNVSDYLLFVFNNAPKGDFVTLDPAFDHKLVFLTERYAGYTVLNDDFSGYVSKFWREIADFEDDSDWSFGSADTTNYVEGSQGLARTGATPSTFYGVQKTLDTPLDLEADARFTDSDYVALAVYASGAFGTGYVKIRFFTTAYTDGYEIDVYGLVSGWNYIVEKKSDFSQIGSGDWSEINTIALYFYTSVAVTLTYDWWRLEKYSETDNANANATGDQWLFQPGTGSWTITEDVVEDTPGATLACIDDRIDVKKVAIANEDTPDDVRLLARVMLKKNDGKAGIMWRADKALSLVSGTEQGYVALIDTLGNEVEVLRYATGAASTIDVPAFTAKKDSWYTMGLLVKGGDHRVYAALSSSLEYDDEDVFSEDHLLSSFEDSNYGSGYVGLMSISTLGRFDDILITDLSDHMVPADEISVEGKAIFRTIAPFTS